MANPVLVEVLRGGFVESFHRGAVAVVDAAGKPVLTLGDVSAPIFPRSAVKLMQALPLIESSAADRYGLSNEELALACSSHSGEPGHVETAKKMLSRIGLDDGALQCGIQWPTHEPSARELARVGRAPTALHNNCSGKHAGMLCQAAMLEVSPENYVHLNHPVQQRVKLTLEEILGIRLQRAAVDGCSIPTFAMPLTALARGFAKLGAGVNLERPRAAAAKRLMQACFAQPWHVGGTGRFCTTILDRLGGRAFVKIGAEGVFGAVLPTLGFGIAVKCDDGGMRAAQVIMAALLMRFLPLSSDETSWLNTLIECSIRNANNIPVGSTRAAPVLASHPQR